MFGKCYAESQFTWIGLVRFVSILLIFCHFVFPGVGTELVTWKKFFFFGELVERISFGLMESKLFVELATKWFMLKFLTLENVLRELSKQNSFELIWSGNYLLNYLAIFSQPKKWVAKMGIYMFDKWFGKLLKRNSFESVLTVNYVLNCIQSFIRQSKSVGWMDTRIIWKTLYKQFFQDFDITPIVFNGFAKYFGSNSMSFCRDVSIVERNRSMSQIP